LECSNVRRRWSPKPATQRVLSAELLPQRFRLLILEGIDVREWRSRRASADLSIFFHPHPRPFPQKGKVSPLPFGRVPVRVEGQGEGKLTPSCDGEPSSSSPHKSCLWGQALLFPYSRVCSLASFPLSTLKLYTKKAGGFGLLLFLDPD